MPLVLAGASLSTLSVLGWLLAYCRYGFDFTDEGFYLVWIANPFHYPASATQFGFVYHPLFELLEGNVAHLRQANVLLTAGLGWMSAWVFLGTAWSPAAGRAVARPVIAALFAVTALSSLVFAGAWLPTPSYNSLCLQGLLLTATGAMLAGKERGSRSLCGWLLLGVGGWLTFMAKPTTAAMLGLMVPLYLWAAGKLQLRGSAVSCLSALGLLVASALVMDGSLAGFVTRLQKGAAMPALLGIDIAPLQLLRLDSFDLGASGRLLLVLFAFLVFCASYLVQSDSRKPVWAGFLLLAAFAACTMAIAMGWNGRPLRVGQFQGLLLFSVPIAVLVLAFATSQANDLSSVPGHVWALGGFLLVLPYAYAFGTGNNYWVSASSAGLFWILASLVLLHPHSREPGFTSAAVALGLGAQLVLVMLLQAGMASPYRQPQPLRKHDYAIDVGRPGSTLMLSAGFGRYIAEAVAVSRQAGLRQGTPVIDLSGRSPGLLYAIGASNAGQAWTLGGYRGSESLAAAMLAAVPCADLVQAWVLLEPEGLGRISPRVLASYGTHVATDFELAGSFMTAPGAGSHVVPRQQQLLKPVRRTEDALQACAASRKGGP